MKLLKRLWKWLYHGWASFIIIDYRMKEVISNIEMLQMLDDLEAEREAE